MKKYQVDSKLYDDLVDTLCFMQDYFKEGSQVYPDSMYDENETIKNRVTRLLGKTGALQGPEVFK